LRVGGEVSFDFAQDGEPAEPRLRPKECFSLRVETSSTPTRYNLFVVIAAPVGDKLQPQDTEFVQESICFSRLDSSRLWRDGNDRRIFDNYKNLKPKLYG